MKKYCVQKLDGYSVIMINLFYFHCENRHSTCNASSETVAPRCVSYEPLAVFESALTGV